MASMLDAQRTGSGGLAKLGEGVRANSDARTQAGLGRGPSQSKKLVNAAWTDTFPAQGATLDLDFANDRGFVRGLGQGKSMDAVTFTRASLGRYVDANGLLAEAANNEPRFDWASTASTGAGTIADPYVIPLAANPTSNGLLIEEARTNRILWCRDATQTQWVKTNVTAAKDQTGIDGVANAASSLTATANDGTCIQTITLASGSRTGSVYLKRLTGTGNVQVSLDGTTWSTVDLSDTEWRRIVISATVTNPTVGIKLAVSGDAVAMDYGQVEDGASVTTPILTASATATRSVETGSVLPPFSNGIFNQTEGSFVMELEPTTDRMNSPILMVGNGVVAGSTSVNFYTSTAGDRIAILVRTPTTTLLDSNGLNGALNKSKITIGGGWGSDIFRASSLGVSDRHPTSPTIPPFILDTGILFIAPRNALIRRVIIFPKKTTLDLINTNISTFNKP